MKHLVLLTALAASPAMAEQICAPHDALVQWLAIEHQESRQVIALSNAGEVVEMFASEDGSWTLVVTTPGGPTCFVAAGQVFQYVNEPLPPMGEEG